MTSSAWTRMSDGVNVVDGGMEGVQRDVGEGLVEDAPGDREPVVPERTAAGNGIFPEAGLRLVDTERNGLPHRRAVVLGVETLLVEAMPDFMEDSEERVAEIVFVVAGGDSAIPRSDARAERVGGYVQPSAMEVESNGRGGRPRRRLAGDRSG